MRRTRRAIVAGFLFVAAACGRHEVRQSEAFAKAVPTEREELAALEAADRQELVTPAPPYWRSESPEAKLKLFLTAESATIRAGDKFRYRLEIQNVGGADYELYEKNSFIKIGERTDSRSYRVMVTFPDGSTGETLPPMLQFDSRQSEPGQRLSNDLFLTLHPGETLSTRPDAPPPNRFRALLTAYPFKQPGRFQIKIVYDTRVDGEGLLAESNAVGFQVLP